MTMLLFLDRYVWPGRRAEVADADEDGQVAVRDVRRDAQVDLVKARIVLLR
jgi:hypothetical protein